MPRVFGFSSGAALALAAAAHGLAITRLALFDTPLRAGGPANAVDHAAALDALVRAGRRGDAVEYFQGRMVGIPEPVIAQMRTAPFRPALEAMAHTLVYEATILGDGRLPLDARSPRAHARDRRRQGPAVHARDRRGAGARAARWSGARARAGDPRPRARGARAAAARVFRRVARGRRAENVAAGTAAGTARSSCPPCNRR